MSFQDLQNHLDTILEAVLSNRIKDSLDAIAFLKNKTSALHIHNKYESILNTYQNMLKYSFEYSPDPQRDQIYRKMQQSVLSLSDDLQKELLKDNYTSEYKNYLSQSINLDTLSVQELNEFDKALLTSGSAEEQSGPVTDFINIDSTKLINRLFYTFLLTNTYHDSERYFLTRAINNKDINWKTKSLLVSAVTLSSVRHFDSEKIFLLFEWSQLDNSQIRQRALIGLFLTLLTYQRRLVLYKDILDRLRAVPDDALFQERLLGVLLQYLRARDTEKITKTIQDEIVPEVLKIRNELEDKLNLNELLSQENFEEKNPEWQNFMKDAPDVYQKLEQFSKMQVEGSDVFMGAFAMLKHFSFFYEIANWFVPFDGKNKEVGEVFNQLDGDLDVPVFLEGLEESNVLCNSDKYSFCLNIKNMPAQQRKMMLEMFNMELKSMNEMASDEIKLNVDFKNKVINTQYLQDIYRYFKLGPDRNQFADVFRIDINILESEVFRIVFDNKKTIRNLAEFHFAKDYYSEALILFEWLNTQTKSFELHEKIGFCYQKIGNYAKAIELYKQAELYGQNKIWLQKKLGFCYRKTGDFDLAIEQYNFVLKSEPNNLNNLAYLGQLHIDCGDFEQALKYYYQVEYKDSKNGKVFRPIGWCSFMLGKYDTAIKYFKKLIDVKPTKTDFLNIAHCYWLSGNIGDALNSYRSALISSKIDKIWFRQTFEKDKKYLVEKGIEELEILLMIDYVLLS